MKLPRFLEGREGVFPLNHLKDEHSDSLFLFEIISILFQELAFLLKYIHRFFKRIYSISLQKVQHYWSYEHLNPQRLNPGMAKVSSCPWSSAEGH